MLCWLVPAANAAAAEDRIVLVGSVLVDREETVGDVLVADGDVTIRGTVSGDVVTVAGQTTLGRRGRVSGDLVYVDDEPAEATGLQVGGEIKKFDVGSAGLIGAIGAFIAFVVSFFLLGLILLLLAPRAAEAIARTASVKALVSALVGLVAFFLIPVIAIAALFTVVGIPLGVVLLFLIVPLYAISYVTTAFVLGRRILKKSRILAFVVGLVILGLLTLIPIAGGLIGFLAVVFGLGLLLMTLLRARS